MLLGPLTIGKYVIETLSKIPILNALPIQRQLDHQLQRAIGCIVVLLAIALTVTATYFAQQDINNKAEALFELAAKDIERDISERLIQCGQALVQTRGFLDAEGSVTRSEFATYVKSIDFDRMYPGIQGIGVAVKIPAQNLESHLRSIRSEGYPNYQVHPDNPRDFYYPIIMLEPFNWRNQRAFGYDMMTESVRRQAMEAARDTGLLTLSGKVRLRQETDVAPQPGFLLYVPKYRKDANIENLDQRRSAIEGFIYSPFRAVDLMQGIFGKTYEHDHEVSFEVYDGPIITSSNLLYSRSEDSFQKTLNSSDSKFSTSKAIQIFGRTWTIYTYSLPGLMAEASPWSPVVTAAAGIGFTVLILRLLLTLQKLGYTADRLRSSEDSYRTLTEVAPQIVWASTLRDGNTYINQFWTDFTGTSVTDALGNGWQRALHPEDVMAMQQAWEQAIEKSDKFFECEMRIRRHDGQYRWHISRARLLAKSAGSESKWLGIATDIHDRKETEQALAQREAHLQLIMDSVPALIAYVSLDRTYLSVNKTYETWFNVSKETIIGQTIEQFHGSEVTEKLSPFIERALRGETVHFEMPVTQQNGRVRHINGTYVPDILSDGKIIGFFVFVMDVSEAKLAEARIQQSYQRFINVARATNDVVWDWQIDSNLRWWSEALLSVFGYDSHQQDLNQDWWISHIHPDDRENVVSSINNHITRRLQSWSETYRFQRIDGSYAYVHDRGYTVFDVATSRPLQMVGALQDISERKLTEEALLKAKEDAEAANQTKTNFLANMSHEIRTPLGVVLGFSELLARGDFNSEEKDQYVESIKRNGELVSNIINDILDISKIEAGKLEIEIAPVNFIDLVKELNAGFELQAREKGIDYFCKFSGPIPEIISTDVLRLKQIVFNIVGNAIKFTSHGHIEMRIHFINNTEPQQLVLEVIDTGPGIAPDNVSKLFEPFSQADASTTRRFGGTGLGLALSRRLAQALGGDVTLDHTKLGQGSTFRICINPGDIMIQAQKIADSASHPLGSAGSLSILRTKAQDSQPILAGLSILVVDDSADNRVLIDRILTHYGAAVTQVSSGHAAIESALSKPFDIVLMDIQMPELDGYEATRTLRQLGYRTPILALTAHALKSDRDKCMSQGFDGYLTKPIQRQDLVSQITQLRGRQTSAG